MHARGNLRGASTASVALVVAVFAACNVYNESLLSGGASGEGGTSAGSAGATSGGSGGEGGSSGDSGGGSGGVGKGGQGGTDPTGGTGGTGKGGSTSGGGTTGAMGGTDDMGGEAGQGGTDAGGMGGTSGTGGAGAAGTGGAGDGGGAGKCGVCGCGEPETDSDSDGVPDCNDTCDGYPDADCDAIEDGLVHRYSFSGSGTTATDSAGTAHGTIVNATLGGAGTLTLSGGNTSTPPYVNLPNGIISALTNATIEAWVTWNQSGTTGQSWQRIFDFGTSGTEDAQASGSSTSMSYLFLTTRGQSAPLMRAAYSTSGPTGETVIGTAGELPRAAAQHIVLTIDSTNDELGLYLNGTRQTTVIFSGELSAIVDVNNWLGRSQFASDYEFMGTYDEFRIYDVALTQNQVRTSSMAGPNAPFLP